MVGPGREISGNLYGNERLRRPQTMTLAAQIAANRADRQRLMGERLLVALTMKGKFGDSGPPSVLVNDRPNNVAVGIVERNSNPSNSAHQSLVCSLCIADQQ